jgi:calcineurin-like phosphoesterase family protein
MSNIFLASDHHLSHMGMITFTRDDGSKLRDFSSIEEHDSYIISKHNSVVRPNDKIYFLGDVTFKPSNLDMLSQMHGEKILIKGNHDDLKLSQYIPYFKDIRSYHFLDKFILSHIPIHPDSLSKWAANIHGHLHYKRVQLNNEIDDRYQNISMECLDDYTPISLEEMKLRMKNLGLI